MIIRHPSSLQKAKCQEKGVISTETGNVFEGKAERITEVSGKK